MFDKITEHIYIHAAEHYTDRPNIGLIVGEKHALLYDAGNSAEHVEKLKKELLEQGLPLPDHVLLSHWHWDHSFGAKFWNAEIIAGRKTSDELKKVSEWKWDEISMENRIKTGEDIVFCTEMIKREYPDRTKIEVVPADSVFDGTLDFDLGGISCQFIHAKGPHSEDSVICYVPSEKFVFLGDANCKDLYGKPWEFDIEHEENFLDNIAKIPYDEELVSDFVILLKKLDFTHCISGHSEIMTKEELFESLAIKKEGVFVENKEIEYAVERIEHLEKIFDEVQNAFKNDPKFFENKKMQVKVSLLTQYLESGQWLRDFSLDEKGKLPKDLKRGILSEDGLYNFLSDVEKNEKKRNSFFGKIISMFKK